MKYNQATKKQVEIARKFSRESDQGSETMSLSQTIKYLDECFKLAKNEMTISEFEKITGHKAHKVRF